MAAGTDAATLEAKADEGRAGPRGCRACDPLGVEARTARGTRYCGCERGREAIARHMQRLEAHFQHAGVPQRLRHVTIESLRRAARAAAEEGAGLDGKREAIRAAEAMMGEGEEPRRKNGLLLYGPNGAGKTGLLVVLARHAYIQGWAPLFVKYIDLIQSVQAGYGRQASGPAGAALDVSQSDLLIRVAQTAPVLILDDLGDPFARTDRYEETEDRRKILFSVIAARHETGRPTFISANYGGREEMSEQLAPRVVDRMREMCTEVEMTGVNLRDAS